MGNYVERSTIRTNMGPLYVILYVWCDKDGAMDSFLRKLWTSSVCNRHMGNSAGDIGPLKGIILATFGSKGAN